MQITILSENTSNSAEFGAEHGLSMYIETQHYRILFDMGQSSLFSENAERCGVDINKVDFAVLSHGHYDHGGGLARFLEINDHAPVYMSEFAFEAHYNGTEKYIGLDVSLSKNPRFHYVKETEKIANGVMVVTLNNNAKQYKIDSAGLKLKENGVFVPEDFRHEQYLLIEEDGKKVLFSGCSHKGILDIVEYFMPDVLIGGFHFSKLPLDETLTEYANMLNRYATDFYTCHCTGIAQFAHLKQTMPRLRYLSAGETIYI